MGQAKLRSLAEAAQENYANHNGTVEAVYLRMLQWFLFQSFFSPSHRYLF
jgi:hypothetical protein